ncbi:hypothetical protein [Sphingobacterium multivorum]|uniref:hypothetical protein n=1 Tax=Sphingobacterium multivorum TaxID=28454 RepID=UPI0031BB113C
MKNKYQNIILIFAIAIISFFAGIAFVNNWLVLKKKYPKIDLYEVPFDANVWGTVSDWAMVIVTFFTAYFLVKTFLEQKNANQLALSNYKKQIMPRIRVSKQPYLHPRSGFYCFELTVEKNDARNITIVNYTNFILMKDYVPLFYAFAGDSITIRCRSITVPNSTAVMTQIFSFTFMDTDGNKYSQSVFARDSKITSNLPILEKSK